jgi:ferritin-like metal-binding protein YciE
MDTLKDLYLAELQDLASALEQSRDITIELEKAATDPGLREALHAGHQGISAGLDFAHETIRGHGQAPGAETCKGMKGLVAEARAHALDERFGDDAVRDAAIIAQYQRMAHYAIAGWGCAKAFAERLELPEVDGLDKHLGQCYSGDETMTDLAQGGINARAA